MTIGERVEQAIRRVRERQRRTWIGPERLWVELRDPRNGTRCDMIADLSGRLAHEPGVRWVRFNARYARLVVAYDPSRTAPSTLLDRLDRLEDVLGYGHFGLASDPRRHPADAEPLRRAIAEVGIEAMSVVAGLSLKLSSAKVRARHVDLAGITTALRGVPRLRALVDRQLGARGAEIVLEAADAWTRAMMQGTTGALVDIVAHGLEIRERRARRRAWAAWEPVLAGDPDAHHGGATLREARIQAIPDGPVERYVDQAILASLSAFAFGLATTGDAEVAMAPVFGGIPRPARVGRSVFVRQLAWRLARSGVLVQLAESLEVLDRLDVLLVEVALAADPRIEPVLTRARDHGIRVVAVGRTDGALPVDQVVATRALRATIRRLQVEGRVVGLVAHGDSPGFVVADLGLSVLDPQGRVPWSADLICAPEEGVRVLALLVGAVAHARVAATHAVWWSGAEAITSFVMALGGVKRQALRAILESANLATFAALVDSVRLVEGISTEVPAVAEAGPPWHAMPVEEVLSALQTDLSGLPEALAHARRPPSVRPPGRLARMARAMGQELDNPLTPVLAGGAGLSALVGSPTDAGFVAAVLLLNAAMGAAQRLRTERLLRGLDRPEDAEVRVLRGGAPVGVAIRSLVPGDVVVLRSGEVVPADCRLVHGAGVEVDESSLTGESLPVTKTVAPSRGRVPGDRKSMLFQGTVIAAGEARAVVVAIGESTEANRALRLHRHRPAPGVEARLESLTQLSVPIATGAAIAMLGAGVLRRRAPETLIGDAVALAVASVPEGLPLLATMAQLSAARRLGARGALVRHPRAVEALGRMQVLCADKTGTLTEGRITLGLVSDGRRVWSADALDAEARAILATALRATPEREEGRSLAHLTDQALLDAASVHGVDGGLGLAGWCRVVERGFEPSRSYAATLGRAGDHWVVSVKGSAEVVLGRCARGSDGVLLTAAARRRRMRQAEQLARRGFRVLAVAERRGRARSSLDDDGIVDLVFRGFVGLSDPVRPTARAAVTELVRAGVDVRLVTGDHPQTALAVAEQLGLVARPHEVLTGDALDRLDDAALAERVSVVRVWARVTPSHKVRIVRAYQAAGLAVGMTGDGANDAPAIQLADVGIALGEHATGAARSAADLVVADGRIETIVAAVVEGRKLWISVRDAVSVLVGGNLGEIGYTLAGSLLTGSPPLNTRQLLLVNLFTDALPAAAIAMMSPEGVSTDRLLQEGPDRSLDERLTRDIAWRATVTACSASVGWLACRLTGGSPRCANTVGLVAIVGSQLGQTLIVGRRSRGVVAASAISAAGLLVAVETPGLSRFFGCRPLGPIALCQAWMAASLGTGLAVVVPRLVHRWGPRARGWADEVHLRDKEWVRIIAESRAASRLRWQVERLRDALRVEGVGAA